MTVTRNLTDVDVDAGIDVDPRRATGGELDRCFAELPAGPLPVGFGSGTALIGSGMLRRLLAGVARVGFWRGKVFSADGTSLRNVITPFGLRAIGAAVRHDVSIADGRPCVVLDYAQTSRVARWIRDEIRELSPGRYLGIVFVRGHRLPVRFLLDFDA